MDDAPIFHIEGAIPFLLFLDGETKTLEILAAAISLREIIRIRSLM